MQRKGYVVFDCTETEGFAHTRIPFAWLATLLARYATRRTGRFHDWDRDPRVKG